MKNPKLLEKKRSYHDFEMSSKMDISSGSVPINKYCIASSPRSGSTLLSRMLFATGLAGNPKEYLNPLLMEAWYRFNQKPLTLDNYLVEMKSRRTSRNGTFGIKIHWRHLEKLYEKNISSKNIQTIMNDFDKFIFISRRDKISQAISYYIASSTGIFHSDQQDWLKEFEIPEPDFNAEQILKHLSDIVREEERWNIFFKNTKKPMLRIYFEDLISNYESKANEIMRFLDISATQIPPQPTKEMQKRFSSKYKELLLQTLGLTENEVNEKISNPT